MLVIHLCTLVLFYIFFYTLLHVLEVFRLLFGFQMRILSFRFIFVQRNFGDKSRVLDVSLKEKPKQLTQPNVSVKFEVYKMEQEEETAVPIDNELEQKVADFFEIFDLSGNNTIDVKEVATVVRALGACPNQADVEEIIQMVDDRTTPGIIHLSLFLPHVSDLFTKHEFRPASPRQLLEAFRVLDEEGIGHLTEEEFKKFMTEYGEPMTEEELDEMMDVALDQYSKTVPYEYYINQLIHEPSKDNDTYFLADEVEAAKPPPPPPPRRFSELMAQMTGAL